MKRRQRVAALLAVIMMFSYVNVFADMQERLPVGGLDYVQVSHTSNDNGENILPSAQVSFTKVKNEHNPPVTGDNHATEFYDLLLTDSLGEKAEGSISVVEANKTPGDKATINLEDYLEDRNEFKNGRLYELKVQPGHNHVSDDGERWTKAPLNSATKDPVKYFVTDLNTIARETEDNIEVVWEYIPGATYKLVYIAKEANNKNEVDGVENNVAGVGSNSVTLKANDMNVFTEGGIRKVKFTIDDTIPGQKYSAYVIVTGISGTFIKDSWSNVGVNTTTPKIAHATRSIKLNITNIGKNRIELSWNVRSWMTSEIEMVKIWRKVEGERNYTLIGTMNNADLTATDTGRFEHDEPKKTSLYYVEFFIKGESNTIKTNEEPYVPYELREQPLKPQVPEPFNSSISLEELSTTKNNYLVKNDDVTVDKMKDNTFHTKSLSPLQVQLVWDAPMKKNENGKTVPEHEMLYDIWVTESNEQLDDTATKPILENFSIAEGQDDSLIKTQASKEVVGFKTLLTQYTNKTGSVKNLLSNKTYYIKIVAKRDYSGTYVESQPTVVAITIDKKGDISKPPVLAKPPLRVQEGGIEQNAITIEWLEKWYEIKAKDPSQYSADADEYFLAKMWNSVVYTGGIPEIKFKAGQNLTEHRLINENELKAVKAAVPDYSANYEDREVSLGEDVKYEVKPILYDDVVLALKSDTTSPSAIKIEKWIVENESDSVEGWTTITPSDVNHNDGLPWKDYKVADLKANTRYVILIRAYRTLEDGTKLMQTFPSFVIATTDSDFEQPEAIPMVPVLNPNGVTDSSVSVWWQYNEDFNYEIVYSRLDNPESAISWPVEISTVPGEDNYVSNGAKAQVTITGLMPDTTYNVWIRAKQKKGDKVSAWSNPVTQTTLSIEKPDVPRGLGPAAYQSILEIGQDFMPVTGDYITVEWLKDVEDVEATDESLKAYSYVLEFANNPEFLDAIVVNTSDAGKGSYEVLAKNMVKFTGLDANKPYYVRVKTVLTFTDPESKREIVKESDFCAIVRIMTKTSDGEYDGGDNDNIVIYPEAIVDSYTNGVWTKEIVDTAKIISQIQNANKYFLTITMENYKNKYDADVRRLKMPKNIVDALINQGMALKVITNVGIYEIPGKALKIYSNQYSARDMVQIDLTKATTTNLLAIGRSYPEAFVKGERFAVMFRGSNKNTVVQKLDDYMKVKLKLELVGEYNFANINTYMYSYNTNTWSKQNPVIETQTDSYFVYSTPYTGLHALYERVTTTSSSSSTYVMDELKATYDIRGLGDIYFMQDYVYGNQYIQLVMGIAQNKSSIDLTASVTNDLRNKARTSGIYMSQGSGVVTKEQAIAGVVKLYELKQGYQVKPSKVTLTGVSSTYKDAVGKAYALGLIDETINPSGKVTYSELCDWIIQVIE